MNLTDDQILLEAIRMVESGVTVTFPVNGRSMLPFIIGGRESLVLTKPENFKVGDIVLAYVDGNRFVIHRVERIQDENVTLLGDGNLCLREHCKISDVKALATHAVNAKGVLRDLYTRRRRFAAKLWKWAIPVRKYLLFIYRKTHPGIF